MASPSMAPTVSSRTLRWTRVVCWVALYSAFCTIGAIIGLVLWDAKHFGMPIPLSTYIGSTLMVSIFWLPCLFIFFGVRSELHRKTGLALAVGMGGIQFLLFAIARSGAQKWDEKSWIQDFLLSAILAQLLMVAAAIRAYYGLRGERGDGQKLLASCSYAFVLLLLIAAEIPCSSFVAGPIPRNQAAAQSFMWSINRACSDYANKFGGVYPSDLGVLKTSSPPTSPDCTAAGLLEHPFDEDKFGYRIEYKGGPLSEKAIGGCAGAKTYTIMARPVVMGKTGFQSFFMDESGVLRATQENRVATASDPKF